ncbi:SDR family NAD(P)-dependent oxidoreductase [Phormidesmis priestleyi ULC007]|uniref:SDR family NAD(P)-dependent oxidoreductase n=1 Tax=Phormidesmis priestleyi ULC007 TaxID=1920490 RepID=A0A2T1DNS3_9CYAN|nr:SDR family oxidoreductase [Phormidesmis priestleyi]PSB22122.1 SDR family NAD(P)-dependent oxidoreductase [Phormidesmis priestleyi ULC007]PZO52617.1 MAG: SDR family NAD(P)-dependent oxidoreductase [Phormidesmis priestleyi]
MSNHVFLAGASQGVGREILKGLLAQDTSVKAFLRSELIATELQTMGVETAIGDALNLEQIEQAMAGSPIDLVISTIGGKPQDGERSDYTGNKNLIDAAVKAGVKRFILVTSIGSGESVAALPLQAFEALKEVLAEKEKAEQHLIASGLTYTIIRPGGLKSEPATGNGVLTEDPKIAGTIHRADVADLVCRCLKSDRTNNKIFSAVDRTMTYSDATFEEFAV